MSFQSTLVAIVAILATSNAHVVMQSPVPYSVDKIDNGPITAAQFPCKKQNGFTVSTMNQMAVGKHTVELKGSAIHGGGSCQLSVTLDKEPTENSVFKVIKSFEGNCPPPPDTSTNVGTIDFELPDSIPNGQATFAWTWFSRLAGQKELYMNCAPIEVTGGASDTTAFDALPDMLVANIESSQCKQVDNTALKFPNPGISLAVDESSNIQPPTGECGTTGNTPTDPAESAAPSVAPSSAPSSVVATEPPTVPTNTGGIFAPGASSAVQSTLTTLVTVTAAPSAPVASSAPIASSAPPAETGTGTPQPTGAPSTGGGTACTENGAIVCNGTKQFGLCNNGQLVWQDVAAGTTCNNGVISKRAPGARRHPRAVVPGKDFTPSS